VAPGAGGAADQVDQRVARQHRIGCRAGMTIGTGTVEFARSNAGEPNARTFLAPYRPVAVPHGFGGAGESLAGRHDCGCEKKKCRHSNFLADRSDQSTNFHWCQRPTQQVRQNGDQVYMRIPWRGKGLRRSATEHLTAATSVQCPNTIRKN